jgi:long-chain acyl-CoA synthetase
MPNWLAASVALPPGWRQRLKPGDRVGLVMKNCPAYLELMFACWHAGLVAVPINAKLHPKELEFILIDSGARLCFATPTSTRNSPLCHWPGLDEMIDVDGPGHMRLFAAADGNRPRAPTTPAWLFYTSGTTGRPKGVTLTQRNLMAAILNYLADVDPSNPATPSSTPRRCPTARASTCCPTSPTRGLNVVPASGGFEPAEIFELLRAHRGVTMFAAPTMVKRLVEHPRRPTLPASRPSSMAAARCTSPTARRRCAASASSWCRSTARANRR